MAEEKSLLTTYVLWFFFGWLGLHHVYLRRDKQAFVWWSTLGGVFFMGWFRDLWRIPQYVEDANDKIHHMESLRKRKKLGLTPQFNVARFAGEMAVGYFYGVLVRLAIPDEVPETLHIFVVPIGIGVGVYIVGNIGREKGPFKSTCVTAFLTYRVLKSLGGADVSYMYCSLAASCMFNYYRTYDLDGAEKSTCSRVLYFIRGACVICILWCFFFYFNATVTYKNKETIRLRDSVSHFFKSPAWVDFKKTMWELYEEGRKQGWQNVYEELVTSIDPTGEKNAYRVLGVYQSASEEHIRKAYKKLVVMWHPDRYQGANRDAAQRKFIDIQQSYEILTRRRKATTFSREKERGTEF